MADEKDAPCDFQNDSAEPTLEHIKARKQFTLPCNVVLNIAVTGESGVGKSSFVNAIRGLTDTDEGAAPVGEIETTMEPTVYPHPTMPNVNFWDLPGIGTKAFNASSYAKKMKFESYDFFFIVSATRFKENDTNLAKEIRKKKKNFFFLRTKIDSDVANAEKRGVIEQKTLQIIRDNCARAITELGPPPVFLIVSHDLNRFDFQDLVDTLERVLPENSRGAGRGRKQLGCVDNVVLNIAVTGHSGAGKSSFVNALRGLTDTDEGAAPVGVVETTVEPTVYPHPTIPNVNFWDLPGVGTDTFNASSYVKKMNFETFDLFFLLSETRFKENDIKLAEEIKKKKKNFLFLRTKIETDVVNAEKRGVIEQKTLQTIRDDCVRNVIKLGPPPVFLIESHDLNRFDFQDLVGTLERILQENKKKAGSGREVLDCLNNVVSNIAVIGESGAGKTSFVNAIRGLTDTDEGAAPVREVETTKEPTVHPHPTMPNVNFWDLPGIGTKAFNASSYAKKMKFETYHLFILVSETIFHNNYTKLAEEIKKRKKNFYFVLSKMDIDVTNAERGVMTEEETFQKIRDDCVKNLTELGPPPVFLIATHDLNRFDFPKLMNTLEGDLPKNKREVDRGRELLDSLDNVMLDIAVIGESGAGKSSFVNAIRSLTDTDEGAAPVGEVETTMEPTVYPHPTMPNVNFWDLPGIGTKAFNASSYAKKIKLETYDFFIIVSAFRFTENDIKLAEELKRKNKNFYFVRTKIDSDVTNAERGEMTEKNTLQRIRVDCAKNLSKMGPPPVFLITSHDLNRFDFPKLVDALERDLPEKKRYAMHLSLPVYSQDSLDKKYKMFKKSVWALAAVSGGIGGAPVPGLSTACDVAMAMSFFTKCYHSFGLDDKSLTKLGKRVNKPILDKVKESELIQALAKKTFLSADLLSKLVLAGVAETACIFVPVAGNIIAAGVSFATTRAVLSKGLKELYNSAKSVLEMAELK